MSYTVSAIQPNAEELKRTEGKKSKSSHPDFSEGLCAAYGAILECLNLQNQFGALQTKQLEVNAAQQLKLNSLEAQEHYQQLTRGQLWQTEDWVDSNGNGGVKYVAKTITQTELDQIIVDNTQVDGMRTFIANKINVERQNAQIGESQVDNTTNNESQSVQLCGFLAQTAQQMVSQMSSAMGR